MAGFSEPPEEVWMIGVIPPSGPGTRLLFDHQAAVETWLRENAVKILQDDRKDQPWEVRSIFVLKEGEWHHFRFQFEHPKLVEVALP